MKRTALAAAASLLLAGVAVAQPGPPPGGWGPDHRGAPDYRGGPDRWTPGPWNSGTFWRGAPESPRERIQFLQARIERGRADGSLSPREANRAMRDLNGVRQWIRRMHWEGAGPLTAEQNARVQARLDEISRRIRWMRRNG